MKATSTPAQPQERAIGFIRLLTIFLMFSLCGCGGDSSSYSSSISSHYNDRMLQFRSEGAATDKIMVVGDSITEGWALPEGYANRGIGNDTTSGVLLRINDHISERPRMIILFIGSNDLLLGFIAVSLSNHHKIMDSVMAAGIPLKIVSLLPRNGYDVTAYNDGLRTLAADHGVSYCDWISSFNLSLTRDGIHPNADGYKLLTELLVKVQ